ncbi:helix-turn-helix domain-containing protein [Actinacidiphila oryziradicis]|uniref:Helix-turn-helix domain-containing protein n=1 Tax=Actinacidiphila oryziradicis TaxID=2571141 RepID=A0A4V5MZ10_9ACTN|nr:helix-turn-helix domain-containing protein [Actinacidiphila oryziradicis]
MSRANSHGCSASIDTLAEKAGLSRRAADRAIKALREHGLIRNVGTGYNWVKVYHLGIPK